jgi:outer membrane protein assembly factor BamB
VDQEGEEVWSETLIRGTRNDGSPIEEVFDAPLAFFGSTVVAGSAYGIVYALDAATGNEKWRAELDGTILGTPNAWTAPSGQTILLVIEQDFGVLHGLDLADGSRLWKTEGVDRCDGSPSVANGVVVFGSCAAALHVFSAEDGTHLRDIAIDEDSQVAGGVALVGDSVYSGCRSGKVLHANTKTGETLWINQDTDYEVFSTPAVNENWVVYGSEDGNIYGLDRATGTQRWVFPTQDTPASPVIAGDKVVVTSAGTLYVLRLVDGEALWSTEVSDTITSPAIVRGSVVVGSDDGTVTAFGS